MKRQALVLLWEGAGVYEAECAYNAQAMTVTILKRAPALDGLSPQRAYEQVYRRGGYLVKVLGDALPNVRLISYP